MRGFGFSRFGIIGALAAASMAMFGADQTISIERNRSDPMPVPGRRRRSFKGYIPRRSRTTLHATNGKRECARRRRQIAEGKLKRENRLVVS